MLHVDPSSGDDGCADAGFPMGPPPVPSAALAEVVAF